MLRELVRDEAPDALKYNLDAFLRAVLARFLVIFSYFCSLDLSQYGCLKRSTAHPEDGRP